MQVRKALLEAQKDFPLLNRQIRSDSKSYEHMRVVYDEILRVIEGPGGEISSSASPDLLFVREERQENSQMLSRVVEEIEQSIIRRACKQYLLFYSIFLAIEARIKILKIASIQIESTGSEN